MKQSPPRYFVIIPAAGLGVRMKTLLPKQYLSLNGKKIIEYTLATLLSYPIFEKYIVVLNQKDTQWSNIQITSPHLSTTLGGEKRFQSVFNGLLALKPFAKKDDWILVHDAVRPLLHHADINKLISHIGDHPVGGLLGKPATDTIKYLNNKQQTIRTINRDTLWHALTPQMFRYYWLFKALASAIKKKLPLTDEANAIELLGKKPKIVEGRPDNIKITIPSDLNLLRYYLSTSDFINLS